MVTVGKIFQYEPYHSRAHNLLIDMGAPEDDIQHYINWMKAHKWNFLDVPKKRGVFADLVKMAEEQELDLTKQLEATRLYGIPVIHGGAVFVALVLVVAAIIVLALCVTNVIKPCTYDSGGGGSATQ